MAAAPSRWVAFNVSVVISLVEMTVEGSLEAPARRE
jgi:hypothetical protein